MGDEAVSGSEDLSDPLVGAGDVLLLYDDLPETADGHYCEQALTVGKARERAELQVRFTDEDALGIGLGDGHNNRQPAKRGLIVVGDGMEARTIATEETDFEEPVVTDAILDPADLQAIGTSISRFCQHWDDAGFTIAVCFDSLTAVLEAVEPETAFHFVHVLGKRLAAVGATAHFHVDPDAHDEAVLGPFEDALDEVFVEFQADESTLAVGSESGRASDADLADTFGDNDGTSKSGNGDPTSTGANESEASDDDIADALGDH